MRAMPPDKTGSTDDARLAAAAPSPPEPEKKGRKGLGNRVRDARATIDVTKRTLRERADRERDKHESVRTLFNLYDEDKGRGGQLLAGGLAYRLFIWLLPAALVASSLFRLIADICGHVSLNDGEGHRHGRRGGGERE